MININYQKRKNTELFKGLESPSSLFLSKTQNYIPIYNRFFSLNDTNYNNINLNHKWYITSVNDDTVANFEKGENENENENEGENEGDNESDNEGEDDYNKIYSCRIKNVNTNKVKDKDVFFKLAPLLDPFKYLIGKYNNDDKILNLPSINSDDTQCNSKILDMNNSAYVDGLFLFLSSNLIYENNFHHGVDYYGSFLAIKNDFVLNIYDDIDYLNNSEFFNKNKNGLFKVDEYDHLFQFQNEDTKLKPLKIDHNISVNSNISIKSFDNELFEDVFNDDNKFVNLEDLKGGNYAELIDITNTNITNENDNKVSLKSNSTCSSRTSYTVDGENDEKCDDCPLLEKVEQNIEQDIEQHEKQNNEKDDTLLDPLLEKVMQCEEQDEEQDDTQWESDDESFEEERINATIPQFPVQVICMEFCENTFDDLILSNDLKEEEWMSAFMQIIMILITYQKTFAFTHNDLHSNNVMYNYTDKKFIYYCYKKQYYKVPTFGRIFKIIDFGRSIYKYNGKLFCSDSFQIGNDAATQYNTEPYFNETKPRLEPNYSFDLCRLACSIFDYVVEDMSEVKDINKCDPVKRIIVEWCLDDKGINVLYKNNGQDRYPDFKLYKMIARCVHNHTPQAQLERPEFKAYVHCKGSLPNDVIDIDKIPVLV